MGGVNLNESKIEINVTFVYATEKAAQILLLCECGFMYYLLKYVGAKS
jgi:response regulator of citrate/malate metabolism